MLGTGSLWFYLSQSIPSARTIQASLQCLLFKADDVHLLIQVLKDLEGKASP